MARSVENQREDVQTEAPKAPTRNPGLKPLDKLVGTWKVSGETEGTLSYEWMEGGFFLVARGDTKQNGQRTRHTEIIGYDHEMGAEPANVMTSRLYTDRGDTLSYTHEVDDKGVTSWFGAKGSPTVFKARWIDDNTLTGAWEWPGGGYKLTLTRIKTKA
ncbi:MAG TPA: hypothetical protein VNE19_09310 [Methylomirabilota bacterium]|jgi:hypothetical protein|nr:hypothetical protein [Methylomirabilota bacterium]